MGVLSRAKHPFHLKKGAGLSSRVGLFSELQLNNKLNIFEWVCSQQNSHAKPGYWSSICFL